MTDTTESLRATEAECAQGRTAPRVSLADIEANIAGQFIFTGAAAIAGAARTYGVGESRAFPSLDVLTICILVTRNGFTIIGKSAPASPENFDADLGAKLAREDAIRQLWPLMGYALRQRLYDAMVASELPMPEGGTPLYQISDPDLAFVQETLADLGPADSEQVDKACAILRQARFDRDGAPAGGNPVNEEGASPAFVIGKGMVE